MTQINLETAIIIPIRMHSSRLPGKFHAQIGDKPMIYHVIDRARESEIGEIYVAVDHEDHFKLVEKYGAKPVMTSPNHQSGSDRVYEALCLIDPEQKYDYVINLQGDMPFFDSRTIKQVATCLANDEQADMSTIAALIKDPEDVVDPNVVKVIFNNHNRAIYFSRSIIPFNRSNDTKADYYYHIGLYAYRRNALKKFVNLPTGILENIEKLEQLRLLENQMTIAIDFADEVPISVDTPSDLDFARNYYLNQWLSR